jgi:hypothetical protein
MAISDFIPELWSARLQRHLDRTLVFAQPTVCNRDWEGEIKKAGDTVHINKVGDPEIKDYDPGEDMDSPEEPTGTTKALIVDQFKYFNVSIDDVNAAQVNVALLDRFAERAGVKMSQKIDSFVGGLIVAASTVNKVGTDAVPVVIKADDSGDLTPYELAVELRRQIAGKDAPLDSLWLAINADFEAEIMLDPKYLSADAGAQVVRTGAIGTLAGFEILRTSGVPTSPGSGGSPVENIKVTAGAGNYATTFANQVTELKAFEPEARFADAIKGLEVYGAKVLEPETIAVAHVAK